MDELEEFKELQTEKMKEIIEDEAKKAVKELKATSPKKKGKYAKGWKKKIAYENSVKKRTVIHNSVYQLTHLLEKGHAKRGGGRVEAREHIKPIEDKVAENITRRMKKT